MATVDQLIQDARTHSNDAYSQATNLVSDAQTAIRDMTFFNVFGNPNMPELHPAEIAGEIPQFQVPELAFPDAPSGPSSFEGIPALDVGAAPEITAVAPTLLEPAKPGPLRDFQGSAPSIQTEFTFPEPPAPLESISFLPPEIVERDAPVAPALSMPVFEATPPGAAPDAPTDLASQLSTTYESAAPGMRNALAAEFNDFMARINPRFAQQMEALEQKLTKFLEGGTALAPAVENAIFERSRAKVAAEARRTIDTAWADAANRGFTLPPMALQASIRAARSAGMDANARAAMDIAIKQAELEQANVQFAITQSANLRQVAMSATLSYHGNLVSLNGQALAHAQALVNAMVQVFNLQVQAFTAKLDGYRAEAAVYETRLRGVQALVDVYRGELDALKTLTEVDQTKVRVYEARLQGLQTLANVYRTQVETVTSRASLEKLKLDLFGAQVQLYEAESRGKSSEWQAYSAALGGQEARMRAFGEEVRAQAARVDAFRATVDAKRAQVQTALDYNRGLVDRHVAEVGAYRAQVEAQGQVARSTLEVNQAQLQAVQASLSAQESQARVHLEYFKNNALTTLELFRHQTQMLMENGKMSMTQLKAVADVSLAGARIYEGLAAAALSGQNTLVTQTLSE